MDEIKEIEKSEVEMNKEELKQLVNDIHSISDTEPKTAVETESENTPQEDSNSDTNSNLSNDFIKSMNKEDILKLYSISKKVKENPSYNVVPDIPEKLFNAISKDAAIFGLNPTQIAAFAREMILEIAEDISMNKDSQDLEKGLEQFQNDMKSLTTMPELIDLQAEGVRKQYEEDLLKNANDPEKKYTEEERNKMRSVSQAFTDSYTFIRQKEFMQNELNSGNTKTRKIIRKRFDRYCDDFNFTLNKVITNKKDIRDIMRMLPTIYPNISEMHCKVFIAILLAVSRNTAPSDTAGTMFMYSSLYNITSLAGSNNVRSKFGDKRIKILDSFIEYLDEFMKALYPVSKETVRETPTRDKSNDSIMSEESIDETAKKIDEKIAAIENRTIEDAINDGDISVNSVDTDLIKSRVLENEEKAKEDTPNTEINAHINVKSPEPSAIRDVSPEEAINN